ncbi:MAG: hypothetical protein WCZ86_06115 [Desulfurivibrionaceae bacterium]
MSDTNNEPINGVNEEEYIPTGDSKAAGSGLGNSWRCAKGNWVKGRELDGSFQIRGQGGADPYPATQAIGILLGATSLGYMIHDDDGALALSTTIRVAIKTAFGEETFVFPTKSVTPASIAVQSLLKLKKGDRIAITLRTSINQRGITITYPGFSVYPQGFAGQPERIVTENKGKGTTREEQVLQLVEDVKTLRKSQAWVEPELSISALSKQADLVGWADPALAWDLYLPHLTSGDDPVIPAGTELSDGVVAYKVARFISRNALKRGSIPLVPRSASAVADENDPFADE